MKSFVMALSLALVPMVSSNVLAQGYAAFMPVGPVPVAAYYAPAPVVNYGPVVATSYYAPAPYLCRRAGGNAVLRRIAGGGWPIRGWPRLWPAGDRSAQDLCPRPTSRTCSAGDAVTRGESLSVG